MQPLGVGQDPRAPLAYAPGNKYGEGLVFKWSACHVPVPRRRGSPFDAELPDLTW